MVYFWVLFSIVFCLSPKRRTFHLKGLRARGEVLATHAGPGCQPDLILRSDRITPTLTGTRSLPTMYHTPSRRCGTRKLDLNIMRAMWVARYEISRIGLMHEFPRINV